VPTHHKTSEISPSFIPMKLDLTKPETRTAIRLVSLSQSNPRITMLLGNYG
jgi:hypothetical protein